MANNDGRWCRCRNGITNNDAKIRSESEETPAGDRQKREENGLFAVSKSFLFGTIIVVQSVRGEIIDSRSY